MKNLKRVLSLMMAVLLCFGLFPGSAFAAENDYDGYLAMIEYNGRGYSLSENLPAPFGGHSTEKFFELRINDLTTYRTAYCIQMGVRANSGIGYESSDDYASFTEEQKALINTALTLGYNVETGTKYGGSAIDEYIATQILIWLIAHNQLGTGYESQIVNEITANSPAAKPIFYTLRENVMNYRTIPSFATDDPGAVGSYTHALQYNESTGKNETTLVDENNVLGDFTFSYPGVDFSVDGNQLHVSTSETEFGTITAEKNLPSSVPGVVTGGTKYWLRDTYQNVVTFDVEGEAQPVKCCFSLEIKSGALQIVKTSEDGEVSGIPFHISGNGVERDVVTGPDGTIGVDNLQAGTYTITERSPDRYVQPASQQVTIYPGQTSSVSFSNVLKKFTVTMEKVDSVTGEAHGDASLDGAVYGMFKGETLLDTYTTSGGGKFTTKEYPCGPDYSIREISPSEGYLLDETVYPVGAEPGNFTLEHNSIPMTATEDVVLGSIAITKHTDQPAIPEQDAPAPETESPTEEEATVPDEQLTESAEETPAPSTPENGAVSESGSEPSGQPEENEAAIENQAGDGSAAPENDAVQEPTDVDQPDASEAEAEAVPLAVTSNEVQIEQPEAGAEFQVYLASAGSYENAKESERDILLTDSYGFAQSKSLPYGLYVVHQTAGAEGQKFVPDFSVFISEHGKTYYFILNNPTFTSLIRFEKRDAESGEIIPLAGTSVKIRNADTGEWVVQHINYPSPMDIDTFVTDSTGTLMLPEALGFGSYELYEQQSPWGYVLDDEPVPFVVDGTQDVVTVTKYNTVQKGTITVRKEGEVFSHVAEAGGLYQPQYEVQGQPGAVYDITALEDIVTPDGVVHAKAGELVATLTTGSDGTATSEPLYLGRYQVSERTAPAGMALDPEPKEVTLAYAGQEVSVTTADVGFVNERQKVEISLKKLLEQDETFSIGMNEEWKNITFGLFAAEEIVAADGSSIPADGLIETTGIDENGNAAFKTDLPCGASLYVKEIGTDEHYLLSNEKYMGDVLLQKTYTVDFLTKKKKKNNGELTQYYITDNHPAIIPREDFLNAQLELARRNSKKKVSQKKTKSVLGKYCSKYALSERLVCGECGSMYRRTTWSKKGKKKVVWRCINRLEFGTKYCQHSPTLSEEALHQAILQCVQTVAGDKDDIMQNLRDVQENIILFSGSQVTPQSLEKQINKLEQEMSALVKIVAQGGDSDFYAAKLRQLSEQKMDLTSQLQEIQKKKIENQALEYQYQQALIYINNEENLNLTEFNDDFIRRIIEQVTVLSATQIRIRFVGGYEQDANLPLKK